MANEGFATRCTNLGIMSDEAKKELVRNDKRKRPDDVDHEEEPRKAQKKNEKLREELMKTRKKLDELKEEKLKLMKKRKKLEDELMELEEEKNVIGVYALMNAKEDRFKVISKSKFSHNPDEENHLEAEAALIE